MQELLTGTGIPQGIDNLARELDLLAVERDDGFDLFRFLVLRHLQGTGQAGAFLAAVPPLGGLCEGVIGGGLHVHAADQLGVGG